MCDVDCWIGWKKHIVNRRQSSARSYRREEKLPTYFWKYESQNVFFVDRMRAHTVSIHSKRL